MRFKKQDPTKRGGICNTYSNKDKLKKNKNKKQDPTICSLKKPTRHRYIKSQRAEKDMPCKHYKK